MTRRFGACGADPPGRRILEPGAPKLGLTVMLPLSPRRGWSQTGSPSLLFVRGLRHRTQPLAPTPDSTASCTFAIANSASPA